MEDRFEMAQPYNNLAKCVNAPQDDNDILGVETEVKGQEVSKQCP